MGVETCASKSAQFQLMVLGNMKRECSSLSEVGCQEPRPYDFYTFTYCLGYLLIALGAVRQLPRLLYKILRDQTGKSYISIANIITLFITNTNFVVYAVNMDLPINTWGEGLLQMGFYVIIMLLMLMYHGRQLYAVLFMFVYITVLILLLMPVIPPAVSWVLMACNLPMLLFRKVNWVYRCYRQKGQTHFSTPTNLALMNVCCMGRLLTAVADTGDTLLILFYLQETLCDILISCQCRYYRKCQRRANAAAVELDANSAAADKRSNCPCG